MGTGATDEQRARWCPQCGAEYRRGHVTCADCGVPLTDAPPPPTPRARRRDRSGGPEHDDCAYDLDDWSVRKRRWIEMMLDGASIRYVWDGGILRVARAHQDAVDDMVDAVDEDGTLDTPTAGDAFDPTAWSPPRGQAGRATRRTDDGPVVAGPGRRLWGWLVDTVVLQALVYAALLAVRPDGPARHNGPWLWALTIVYAVYVVVATARFGRTLGKIAAGTRVVVQDDGRLPGWGRSLARWAVPSLLPIALGFGAPATWERVLLVGVYPVVVYAPVLFDGWRRGLHDRAAGTVVVVVQPDPVVPRAHLSR